MQRFDKIFFFHKKRFRKFSTHPLSNFWEKLTDLDSFSGKNGRERTKENFEAKLTVVDSASFSGENWVSGW